MWAESLERRPHGLLPPGFGAMGDQCSGRLGDSSTNQKGLHKEHYGERAQQLACWTSKQKAEGPWSVSRV